MRTFLAIAATVAAFGVAAYAVHKIRRSLDVVILVTDATGRTQATWAKRRGSRVI